MVQPPQSGQEGIGGYGRDVPPGVAEVLQRLESQVINLEGQLSSLQQEKDALTEGLEQAHSQLETERRARTNLEAAQSNRQSEEARIDSMRKAVQGQLDQVHVYHVSNNSGEQIPAHSPMRINGKISGTDFYKVIKPDVVDIPAAELLFAGASPIASGGYGIAFSPQDMFVSVDVDTAPSVGDTVGTQASSWVMKTGNNSGLVALSATDPAYVRQSGGGASGVALQITGLHSDSPSSDGETMLVADVYANGFWKSKTHSGVTVHLADYPGDYQNVPLHPEVIGIPFCNQQWTGNSGSTYTETVYEAHYPTQVNSFVWEATADASSGTITAKRVNEDGSLASPEKTFDVYSNNIYSGDRGILVQSADGKIVFIAQDTYKYVWEATADASSGTITAKRVNADGSLASPEKTFDVLPS